MNYLKIDKTSLVDGIGVRSVLWISGCNVNCSGCQNPESWDPCAGHVFDNAAKEQLYHYLNLPFIDGITFSGGHPLDPANKPEVIELIRDIRTRFPTKSIWLYTGYVWESFKSEEWVKDVDVIVDGPFILAQRDITLPYRGSKNQRIIDVNKSLQTNQIVLLDVK